MSYLPKEVNGILGGVLGGVKWLIHAALNAFKHFYEVLNRGND